jgi:phosphatidate cytidylyltransferase
VSILLICSFIAALRQDNLRDVLPQVASAFMGAFYAFAPWRFAIDLRAVSVHLLFFALALNWVGDSAAYYVGRRFGKHKLAPVVSPGKSWEGAGASVIGAILFGVIYLGHFVRQIPWWQVILIAAIASVAGQLGDLAESALKRGAGVKDSGNLLPGHGGMLDRVDSSLFALPVVYVLYSLLTQR